MQAVSLQLPVRCYGAMLHPQTPTFSRPWRAGWGRRGAPCYVGRGWGGAPTAQELQCASCGTEAVPRLHRVTSRPSVHKSLSRVAVLLVQIAHGCI